MTERLVVGGVALLVGLLLGWMVRGVAGYNTAMTASTAYEKWRVACPPASADKQACELISDLQDPNGTPAQVVITKDKSNPVIGFTMPFGVALQQGVGLVIGDDAARVLPYRVCNQAGCVVLAPFDDKLRDSLAGTMDARVSYTGLDGKVVPVTISLSGYKTAYKAYQNSEARRASWFWRLWS